MSMGTGETHARHGKSACLHPTCIERYSILMKTPKHLSQEAIAKFKAIYKDEFGVTLTDDKVQEIALRLLRFFGVLRKK